MSDESDRDLAVKTLREICSDFDAPKQAKATAARTLLELSGDIGKLQSEKPRDTKALHELTRKELDEEISRVVSHNLSSPNAVQVPSKSNGAGETLQALPNNIENLTRVETSRAKRFGRASKRTSKPGHRVKTSRKARGALSKYDF